MTDYDDSVRATTREFVKRAIAPGAAIADEREELPLEVLREIGRFGVFGMSYPEQYGGTGMKQSAFTDTIREIAKACASMAMTAVAHNTLATGPIFMAGDGQLKARFLRPLIAGDMIGAFALTEPGSGSDVASIRTVAEECDGCYVLNGSKLFITNAHIADVVVVAAKTSPRAGLLGISLFVVEKGTPGFCATGRREHKLGMRASDTGELTFCDVRVPKANLIGRKNGGFAILQQTLASARLDMAAIAIGIAECARDLSLDYAVQRQQFGKPLCRFQLVQAMLANMEVSISAANLLLERALASRDEGRAFAMEASAAKLFASEMAMAVTKDAIQIHGGYGYSRDLPLERLFRDAKLTEIGDGTSEIQRLIIADEMVKARSRNQPSLRRGARTEALAV